MNFEKFNALVEGRVNYGELENASVVSEYKNIGCGDGYRLYLDVEGNVIRDARYTTTGCSFSLASLAIICDLAKNKSLADALKIQPDELEPAIEGYPERRKNYAVTAVQALQKAIKDYQNQTGLQGEQVISRDKTLELLKANGHLRDQNLNSVMLDKLDLSGVDFSGSNLMHAFLRESNLSGANFSGANLRGAFLNDCLIENTNFENADLRFAKLLGAKIGSANWSGAFYDIGTRVDTKNMHIFDQMTQRGKEIYVKDANQKVVEVTT
ncbi:MAG: iron-sulfur cluster assembly scaffold protein [Spirochaetes bacterium]|nr:iron-sulfur cluster assembly scaffold protein [Spirochaetota bacterium]